MAAEPAKTVTLLHTAEIHRATFAALRDTATPDIALVQHVHPEWLTTAQSGGITADPTDRMRRLIDCAPGPVVCTCTTLGPVAETLGAIRIDRPMMEAAARPTDRTPAGILVVFALESTRIPTLSLLSGCIRAADTTPRITPRITPLFLPALWPLFTSGDIAGFHREIAAAIKHRMSVETGITTVILAQASMAGAAPLLAGIPARVLASPRTALEYAARLATAPGPNR
jgi:hypothetical protein